MLEIKEKQELSVNNVFSYRGKIRQMELEDILKDMESKIQELGTIRNSNPITATYGMAGDYIDIEILLPIDKPVQNIGSYVFKNKVQIVNAVVASYQGHPGGLQKACDQLNQYIMENQLQPITVGYNVTKQLDTANIEKTEIDVYVGISPNIL